jgi:hypothetical protein
MSAAEMPRNAPRGTASGEISSMSSTTSCALGSQMQAPATAIAGVGAAFDESGLLQPVDHAADRDRLHFQEFGQLVLGQAFAG